MPCSVLLKGWLKSCVLTCFVIGLWSLGASPIWANSITQVQRQWCQQIHQQKIVCSFPMKENLYVGDVMLLSGTKGTRSPRGIVAYNINPVARTVNQLVAFVSFGSQHAPANVTFIGQLNRTITDKTLKDFYDERPTFNRRAITPQNTTQLPTDLRSKLVDELTWIDGKHQLIYKEAAPKAADPTEEAKQSAQAAAASAAEAKKYADDIEAAFKKHKQPSETPTNKDFILPHAKPKHATDSTPLRLVAFPVVASARLTGQNLAALIPGETVSGALGFGHSNFRSATLSIKDSYSYGLPEGAMKELLGVLEPTPMTISCASRYGCLGRTGALATLLDKSLTVTRLTKGINNTSRRFWLAVVREAFYTTEIDLRLERNTATRGMANLTVQAAVAKDLFASLVKQITPNEQAFGTASPSVGVSVYSASHQFIGMSRLFDRPLSIGIRTTALELEKTRSGQYLIHNLTDY
jgi:hypothetical protein